MNVLSDVKGYKINDLESILFLNPNGEKGKNNITILNLIELTIV